MDNLKAKTVCRIEQHKRASHKQNKNTEKEFPLSEKIVSTINVIVSIITMKARLFHPLLIS